MYLVIVALAAAAVHPAQNVNVTVDLVAVNTAEGARRSLQRYGACLLNPGHVDDALVARLDHFIRLNAATLPSYSVRNPRNRTHALLLPGDGDWPGDVAAAVAAMTRALAPVLLAGTSHMLVELAAFEVSRGAEAQDPHVDRLEPGYLSCQLALHDTDLRSGGLELWPGSLGAPFGSALQSLPSNFLELHDVRLRCAKGPQLGPSLRACGDSQGHPNGSLGTPIEVAPLRAGAISCYDGNLIHRGVARSMQGSRRVLYFTALRADGDGRPSIGVSALHPSLRCAPLRMAPPPQLDVFVSNVSRVGAGNGWWLKTICAEPAAD